MRIGLSVASALLVVLVGCAGPAEKKPESTGTTTTAESTGSTTAGSGAGTVAATPSAPAPGSEEEFIVIGDRVYFDFDKSELRDEALEVLNDQAAWLNQYLAVTIVIEGHCDERGTREYNLALGERRANAVKDYLISRGVAGERVEVISYGKERPEVVGSNESAWSQNRRGVTVIRSGAQG